MIVYISIIDQLDEIAASLYDGLDAASDLLAGQGDHLLVHGGHHLPDLSLQGLNSVMRGLINICLTNAPDKIIKGITVW